MSRTIKEPEPMFDVEMLSPKGKVLQDMHDQLEKSILAAEIHIELDRSTLKLISKQLEKEKAKFK